MVAYAAAAVTGGVGYLVGGENGARSVPTVTTFRLVTAGQAMPNEAASPWLAPVTSPGRLAPGSDPAVLPADVLIADHHNNRLLIVDPQGRIRWEFPRPGHLAPGQTFLQPDDAFPMTNGDYLVTEINGDWADEMSLSGQVSWSANPPMVLYPSDDLVPPDSLLVTHAATMGAR